MLSSVLHSERAIAANIQIIRTFTRLRQLIASNPELQDQLVALERKHDRPFKVIFTAINKLLKESEAPKRQIGFQAQKKKSRRCT